MFLRLLSTLGLLTFLAVAGSASPIITWTPLFPAEHDHPISDTNWQDTLVLPGFDPALGTLLKVQVGLQGDVAGFARYESYDPQPTTITLNLQATVSLKRPNDTLIVQTIPLATQVDNATAFDGSFDFLDSTRLPDGTYVGSGGTFSNLQAQQTAWADLTLPADLALFTGTAPISLNLTAVGNSTGTGSGNLVTWFNTRAGATGWVRYQYEEFPVPEPATAFLFGAGLLGLTLIAKKRIAKA